MSKKITEKIIDILSKIESACLPEQLKKNKKIDFLLTKKKEYQELDVFQKECWELIKQGNSQAEINLLQEEIKKMEAQKEQIIFQIKEELIKEKDTGQSVVVEIRPGTGGTEAGLFVQNLYRMYYKFVENKGWKMEMVESKLDKEGNFTFVSFLVKGKNVFNYLRNEAGVHRVQRVPETENKGRIHTSTASVVILPEVHDVVLNIRQQDLKIETCRSSGAGGQHVNTTDSAVRITHMPTGIVAICQDGRSQHDNKEKALFILKSRLLEKLQSEQKKELGDLRSFMIGTAERAEKIRTYNWQQNRVTDHRLEISWNKLNFIIGGDLEELCQKLIDYQAEINLTHLFSQIFKAKK